MSLGEILFVLIVFQLLFLSAYLFTQRKGKPLSNRLLGFFFLAIALNLFDVFLLQSGVYFSHPALAGLGSCLPLLFGPLLYFYTRSVIYKDFSASAKNLIHFLPFVIVFCGTEIYYQSRPFGVQQQILLSLSQHRIPALISYISTLIFLQFLCYGIASLRLVSFYKKMAGQHLSNKYTDVSWLYSTILFFILIIIISALNGLLAQTPFSKYYLVPFNAVVILLLLFVIQVMMNALSRPYFFSFSDSSDSNDRTAKISAGEKAEKGAIIQTLLAFMESDKPYLEPELTLEQLAAKLSLKPRALSQAINDLRQQNFFDFINRYRIDEAKNLLTNPKDKKITVLEVLYQVGFNSKEAGFRGYMQAPLEKKYGLTTAIVITSCIFTAIHLSHSWAPPIWPHIFFASTLLGILAYRTGSLIPGIIGHAILDIFDYSVWWTDLNGGFQKQTIFRAGTDLHFVVWLLIFLISLFGFFKVMTKLGGDKHVRLFKIEISD